MRSALLALCAALLLCTAVHAFPSRDAIRNATQVLSARARAVPTGGSPQQVWSTTAKHCLESNNPLTDSLVFAAASSAAVFAYSRSSGALVWTFNGPVVEAQMNGLTLSNDNSVLYTSDTYGYMYALDASTGKKIWQVQHGPCNFNTPLLGTIGSEDVVYMACGSVLALKASTGETVWKHELTYSASSNPARLDNTLYVAETYGNIYAVDANTGKLVQKYESPCGDCSANGLHLYDGMMYLGVSYPCSPEELRRAPGKKSVVSTKVRVLALTIGSGSVIWTHNTPIRTAPVALVDKNQVVYAEQTTGNLVAVNAANGNKIWRTSLGGDLVSEVTLKEGAIFIGGTTGLFKVSYSGQLLESFTISGNGGTNYVSLAFPVTVADGNAYFGTCHENSRVSAMHRVQF